MINIGVVNIDTSHPGGFADYLLKDKRMRYSAIYNDGFRGDDEVDGFIQRYGLDKRFYSIEEMADYVDVGFIQSCNWDTHIEQALPFINKGKPVFIDKPIVGSLKDCRELQKLSSNGAIILGSSSARYAKEIIDFINIPEEERGEIVSVYGTVGVDEFNYGVHIAEVIGELLGTGAVSNKYVGVAEVNEKRCETFFVRYGNGISAVYNNFHGVWHPFQIVIMTTKGTHQFKIDSTKIYGALLDRITEYMETGRQSLATVNEIIESVKIMLAGKVSREQNGIEVFIDEIPEDTGFDGAVFEKGYAKANSK